MIGIDGGNDAAAQYTCKHVAALGPMGVRTERRLAAEVERERTILREQALKEGKPANIVDKMVEGRLRNFYAEKALLEQPFVKDDSVSVGKFAEQHKMTVKEVVHWELGRG